MKTEEFIFQYLSDKTDKTQCSSVMGDSGTIYSYGYHYPLARIIDGTAWINSDPSTVTTAKHRNWARSACARIVGYENVQDVELHGAQFHPFYVEQGLIKEQMRIIGQMEQKKRKDTQVYKWLEYDLNRVNKALETFYANWTKETLCA